MRRARGGANLCVCHSLRLNNIDDEGCKALAAALQTNTTLTYLE
jgi:hypothetical protein